MMKEIMSPSRFARRKRRRLFPHDPGGGGRTRRSRSSTRRNSREVLIWPAPMQTPSLFAPIGVPTLDAGKLRYRPTGDMIQGDLRRASDQSRPELLLAKGWGAPGYQRTGER